MTPEPHTHIVLSLSDAQAIADYLKSKPYDEVCNLIASLLKASPMPKAPTTDGASDD